MQQTSIGEQLIIAGSGLEAIARKVTNGERLSFEEGCALYRTQNLHALGWLANLVRERLHGDRAYFIYNQHVNYSNVCVNGCTFCAFGKEAGQPGAYEMTVEEVAGKVRARMDEPITELHIVGGCHPTLPFDYYLNMLRAVKALRPECHIQGFTCVEIAYFGELYGMSVPEVLARLSEAGLGSLPGGGAEVFSPRVRQALCAKKLSADGWLEVARQAHRLGMRTNATMLYGHIETIEERVEHLIRLRQLQDETGGFLTFIPLAFHPENTRLTHLAAPTGLDELRTTAVARLMLDNFPHIKSFWVMSSPKVAQISLHFGADDIDGTVIEERITHMAGAQTAESLARDELVRLIREAGRRPVERDTLYEHLTECAA
jgi:aminodeoxyfutalosine synthase